MQRDLDPEYVQQEIDRDVELVKEREEAKRKLDEKLELARREKETMIKDYEEYIGRLKEEKEDLKHVEAMIAKLEKERIFLEKEIDQVRGVKEMMEMEIAHLSNSEKIIGHKKEAVKKQEELKRIRKLIYDFTGQTGEISQLDLEKAVIRHKEEMYSIVKNNQRIIGERDKLKMAVENIEKEVVINEDPEVAALRKEVHSLKETIIKVQNKTTIDNRGGSKLKESELSNLTYMKELEGENRKLRHMAEADQEVFDLEDKQNREKIERLKRAIEEYSRPQQEELERLNHHLKLVNGVNQKIDNGNKMLINQIEEISKIQNEGVNEQELDNQISQLTRRIESEKKDFESLSKKLTAVMSNENRTIINKNVVINQVQGGDDSPRKPVRNAMKMNRVNEVNNITNTTVTNTTIRNENFDDGEEANGRNSSPQPFVKGILKNPEDRDERRPSFGKTQKAVNIVEDINSLRKKPQARDSSRNQTSEHNESSSTTISDRNSRGNNGNNRNTRNDQANDITIVTNQDTLTKKVQRDVNEDDEEYQAYMQGKNGPRKDDRGEPNSQNSASHNTNRTVTNTTNIIDIREMNDARTQQGKNGQNRPAYRGSGHSGNPYGSEDEEDDVVSTNTRVVKNNNQENKRASNVNSARPGGQGNSKHDYDQSGSNGNPRGDHGDPRNNRNQLNESGHNGYNNVHNSYNSNHSNVRNQSTGNQNGHGIGNGNNGNKIMEMDKMIETFVMVMETTEFKTTGIIMETTVMKT